MKYPSDKWFWKAYWARNINEGIKLLGYMTCIGGAVFFLILALVWVHEPNRFYELAGIVLASWFFTQFTLALTLLGEFVKGPRESEQRYQNRLKGSSKKDWREISRSFRWLSSGISFKASLA